MLRIGSLVILVCLLPASPLLASGLEEGLIWRHLGADISAADGASGKPGPMTVDIRIDSLTTDQQFGEYGGILWDQGNEMLQQRLLKTRLGTVSSASHSPVELAVVRSQPTSEGTTLLLIAVRPVPFLGPLWGSSSTDPLTVLELHLDQNGVGEGIAYRASGLDFNEDGSLALDNSGAVVLKVSQVRKLE